MSKLCVKCGTEIPEESEFCLKCGKKVKVSKSNSNAEKKKILPFIIGGSVAVVVLVIVIVLIIIIVNNDAKKMIKTLENQGYNCTNDLDNTEYKYQDYIAVCEKEEDNKKRTFIMEDKSNITYNEIIYDSGTEKLKITTMTQEYVTGYYEGQALIQVYQGKDFTWFYPKHCTFDDYQNQDCIMNVGEKVYPVLKDEYDEYKEYFASGKDKEFLRAKANDSLGIVEYNTESDLYDKYSEIKDKDVYTEDVNDAVRYFEKMSEKAGITLGKK